MNESAQRATRAGLLLICAATGAVTAQEPSSQIAAPRQPQAAIPGPQSPPSATPGTSAPPQVSAVAQGGVIHGTVVAGAAGKPGGVPLPGVAVTATNTLTGRKYAAATDVDGAYSMKIPRNGRYVVRVELAAFASATAEVVLNGAGAATADEATSFGLQLASRAEAAEARASAATGTGAGGLSPSLARGLQNLNLNAGGGSDTEDASAGGGNSGAALPSLGNLGSPGADADAGNETVAVRGQSGQTNGLAGLSEDELRDRIQQGVEAARASGQLPPGVDPTNMIVGILGNMMGSSGGSSRGGSGRHGSESRGSGAFRHMDPTQLHGGLNFQGEYATFDSAPWSPTLQPETKPPYSKNTFGATLAGSPYIPGLIKPSTKQFGFLNFNFSRNTTPEVLTSTVPTAAERAGDFSGLTQTVNGQATVTPIYDPATNGQFAYNGRPNVIDPTRITPQALYILNNYYPLPNVPGAGTQNFNYQTVTTSGQNSANLSARFIRNLGSNSSSPFGGGRFGGGGSSRNAPAALRQSLNTSFSFSHSASDIRNIILPLSGATQSNGYNLSLGYVIGYGRFNNTSTVTWNRSNADTRNYFTNTPNDPTAAAGIALPTGTEAVGVPANFYNGLPSLAIDNFLSVNNTNPQNNIGQTISFSDQISYRHKKHNMRFGVDIRRVHQDYVGGGTPLGSFTFTGFNTEDPCLRAPSEPTLPNCPQGTSGTSTTSQSASGSAFADFLLGLPQQTQIQAGLAKIYLRENVLDWYANDDYRVTGGLTINGGLRYEYFGPFSEKNGRLVNLTGVAPGTGSVGCVTPNGISAPTAVGTLTCAAGPTSSLLNADHAMYAPRFGLAYRPHFLPRFTKDTVLRAGYGINFNTGQFATFAKYLSYQSPFATAENNVLATAMNSTGCLQQDPTNATNLTLANGFGCSTKLYQNTYAVDPNYRLGLVQIYNVDIQRTLPMGVVLNIGYNGSHGSDLNVINAANHTPTGVTTPDAVAFTYQQSDGESTFNALTINAQKRLQKGIQLAAKYQYAHSIDDASTFGGATSTLTVQNPEDLHAERSNSSFDVRHQLTGSWLYELPVGPNRTFLNKGGMASKLLDGFSISGTYTLASGSYFTPSYQSTAGQTAAGGLYTLRPNRDFTQPIRGSGEVRSFFNKNAFIQPTVGGIPSYGSASRYSIEGPGQVLVSSSLSRTVPLGETRSFEARVTADNVFNTVQYNGINTTLDSATFGQVTGAAMMRRLRFIGKFRF